MKILFLFLLLSLFFSCNKTRTSSPLKIKGTYAEQVKVVPLRIETIRGKMKYSELVDTSTLSVIPLETTKESVFGSNIECKIFNENIYIRDCQQKTILVFSETGKFLGKVDKVGRSPQEYIYCKDFWVEADSIMILDYSRLLYYNRRDFSFIKSVDLGKKGIAALTMAADDSSYYFQLSEISAIQSSVVITDKNFNVKTALRDPSFGKKAIFTFPTFFKMTGKMYYHHEYNDTLYRPNSKGLEIEYIWDCGERAFNLDQYFRIPVNVNSSYPVREVPERYFCSFVGYAYADSILSFSGSYGGKTLKCLYSLISGKVKIMNLENIEDDVFHMNMRIYPYISENDYFYTLIYPNTSLNGRRPRQEGPFSGRTEDDNPVFLKFKYRKF